MGDHSDLDFEINNSLKLYLNDPATIPTPEADGTLLDCENDPDSLTNGLVNGLLNDIVDAIAENPEAIARSSIFDSLQFMLKCAPISSPSEQSYPSKPDSELFRLSRSSSRLPGQTLSKIFDLIMSGLATEAEIIHNDLEAEEQEAAKQHKQLLEIYGFLLQWVISAVETKAAERPAVTAPTKGRGSGKAKPKATGKDGSWDSSGQLQTAMDTMCKVLKLKLGSVFVTTSERDTFVGLFTRAVYLILESEARVKNTAIRMHAFKVLCIAIKHHGHAFGLAPYRVNSCMR